MPKSEPTFLFTALKLKNLKPPPYKEKDGHQIPQQRFYWQGDGLGLCVSSTGAKSWVLTYRIFDRGTRRIHRDVLGPWTETENANGLSLTLAGARRKADEIRKMVDEGRDPRQVKREQIRDRQQTNARTFLSCAEKFLTLYKPKKKPNLRPRTLVEYRRHLMVDFKALHDRPLTAIRKTEIVSILDDIGNVAANRALATVRKMFNWAMERGAIELPPTAGIKAPAPEISRDRHLFGNPDYDVPSEIALFWKACDRIGSAGSFAKLLLLSGQRRDEVAKATWPELIELTGDNPRWALPSDRAKNWKSHIIALGPLTVEVIRSTPHIVGCKYVFSSDGMHPRSGFNKIKRDLDKAIAALKTDDPVRYRGQFERPWRLHDLRRTAKTAMAALGVPGDIRDAIFNHSPAQAMDRIYVHAAYTTEKRDAMMRWENYIQGLLADNRQEAQPVGERVIEMHDHRENAAKVG
jgi:integrase